MFVCYNCGELEHMIRNCPHPKKQVGYEPLCGRCKEKGHTANTFMALDLVKQIQIEEFEDSRNVNYIKQTISPYEKDVYIMRSQAKAQAMATPRESEPEHGSDSDSKKSNDKVIKDPLKEKKSVTFEKRVIPIIPHIILDPIQLPTQSIPIVPDKPQPDLVPLRPKSLKEIPKSSVYDPSIPLQHPAFYRPPKKASKTINLGPKKRKYNRTMKLEVEMEPYDLLSNMDNIQPQISSRQLLAVAPTCRSALSSSLVRKRPKTMDVVNEINNFEEIVDVNDISIDPSAPTVEVFIDGSLIDGVQIDSGSSVNLMNVDTIEEIGLTTMTTIPIILRMADQSHVKPLGILKQVLTTIGGIDFQIDYIVFKVTEFISPYPILLGRPWLFSGRVKEDWGKGTITVGKGKQKIVLPMYPTQYHGETQNEESEETSDDPYDSERETTNYITQERPLFKSLSHREYFMPKNQIEDSEDEILAWENAPVFNITTEVEVEFEPEPFYITDSDELNENLSYSYLLELQPPKSECVEMNLGTQEDPKTIRIYKNLNPK